MDAVDRLAAYLAGDLDAAETSAVEEDLARDPALRAQLSAMRRADGALLALRSPTPPPGFEERLQRALDPVIGEQIGADAEVPPATGTFDDLAERRASRDRGRRWIPAVAGVAAAAAAIAVIGTNLDLGGNDSAEVADEAGDAGADSAEMFSLDADDADDGATADLDGPVIISADRQLDDDDIEALLAAPELEAVVAQGFTDTAGQDLAARWSSDLGAGPEASTSLAPDDGAMADQDTAEQEAPAADEEATEESDETTAADDLGGLADTAGRTLAPDERSDVARCLAYLTEADDASRAIPAYVELGSYGDDEVIVYGFVSEDPGTGAFTRVELWVAGRDDCEVRYLRQR